MKLLHMLLPIPIILFIVLLVFSIKKAKQKVELNKHVFIRLLVLLLSIGLIFLLCYIEEGKRSVLGAMYFSAYFFAAWLLYLLVEAISLFVVKQNKPAKTNLIILSFVVFIVAMAVGVLYNT